MPMTEENFIDLSTRFMQRAEALAEQAKKDGLKSLENEIFNFDETEKVFSDGLVLIIDNVAPHIVDKTLSDIITQENDEYLQHYQTIQKQAILRIQAGEKIN